MKIPIEVLLELTRLHADIGILANKTAEMEYEIYKRLKFTDEEDSDYGSECERCGEKINSGRQD